MQSGFKTAMTILSAAAFAAALLLIAGTAATMSTQPAAAAMKKKGGKDCTICHTTPPALNAHGREVKAMRRRR